MLYPRLDFSLALEILFPVFYNTLSAALHHKRVGGNGLGYRRPCGGCRVFADLNRRNEVCVAADESMVAYLRAEMVYPVIVGCNAAAAEIHAAPHVTVPYIGEMACRGIFADSAVLYLDKIPDFYSAADYCPRAELREWTHGNVVFYRRGICLYVVKLYIITHGTVFYMGISPDFTVGSDNRISKNNGVWQYRSVAADFYVWRYYDTVEGEKFNSLFHKTVQYFLTRFFVKLEKSAAGIRSKYDIWVDTFIRAGISDQFYTVGKIIFSRRVLGRQLRQHFKQLFGIKPVCPAVHLAYFSLIGGTILLFANCCKSPIFADYSAVADRVFHFRGNDRHRRFRFLVKLERAAQGIAVNKRSVAAKYAYAVHALHYFCGTLYRVTRAFLLRLQVGGKIPAGLDILLGKFIFIARYHGDGIKPEALRRVHYPAEHGLFQYLAQNFGLFGFHALSRAARQNNTTGCHCEIPLIPLFKPKNAGQRTAYEYNSMKIILYYLLRRLFVKLCFEPDRIVLEKGLVLRRRAVVPLKAITRTEIRRGPLLRLLYAKKITVETLSGKISFYLKKDEDLPFLPKNRGHIVRPKRSLVFFGAFVDTRALSGVVLFSFTLYRIGKIFGSGYIERIIAAISDTAAGLSNTMEQLHIAIPRAAALAAVFLLTAWGFAFVTKLMSMADFRVSSHEGFITVRRGLIILYEQVVVLNNLDAVISCQTVSAIAVRKAPLYARGTMIFPPVGQDAARRVLRSLCGSDIKYSAETKPPLRALFGHCAVSLGWAGGFSAALVLTKLALYFGIIPSAELLKTVLWYGLAASLWAVLACGLYWRFSGVSDGASLLMISARKGYRLYGAYIPKRMAVLKTLSQNPFQRRAGLCDLTITLYGKRRFRLRGIPRENR